MRLGFELSFSTSYIFSKSQPFFVALDDITFLKPVEIGDILKLKSTVVYTKVIKNIFLYVKTNKGKIYCR
jgi:acyl-coenzyme A thioesterase 9